MTNTTRAQSALAQQRVQRTDEAVIGGDVDVHCLRPDLRVEMGKRRQLAERSGIADEDVELLPAFEDRRAQTVNAVDSHATSSGTSVALDADGLDGVIQFFQPALGACGGDDVGAFPGQVNGRLKANAAGRAR